MRLFRQPCLGDWDRAIVRVAADLSAACGVFMSYFRARDWPDGGTIRPRLRSPNFTRAYN
jgi:hypothetical protein